MRRMIFLLICLFAIPLAIACGDDVGDDPQDPWVGENQSDPDCFDEDRHDAPIDECPIGCPEEEGWSYFEDDCGCACLYGEPDPPIVCPDDDDGYYYVSDDPDECTLIDFTCEDSREPFFNDCGCGCRDVEILPPPVECEEEEGFIYDYYFEDPDGCAAALLGCPDEEGTYYFENDCGCGCKHRIEHPPTPTPACEAQDARGEGYCLAMFGWAYNGRNCTMIGGCECVGDDCDDLYISQKECEQAYDDECFADACEPMDADGEGLCDMLLGYGYFGDEQGCTPVGGCECVGDDCDYLYMDQLMCEDDHRHCAEPEPEPVPGPICSAWDVEGVGACDEELGVGYDGEKCRFYSGCSCQGSDCNQLTDTIEDCKKYVRDCDYHCGDPDGGQYCDDTYPGAYPTLCPDGTAYTYIGCTAQCVDPDTCETVDG